MKRCYPFYTAISLLTALIYFVSVQPLSAYAQDISTPPPTYDPLVEPFVPENPSDYELGRNWYWHNCMTCHGDAGQGLTDEFRAIWPEDHQNCWDHGCHGGRVGDEGFPIPTTVPALVDGSKLAKFSSQQAFFDFLKVTHPPQDPGCLEDEQYQAIVKYVFNLNDRSLEEPVPVPTLAPTSTSSPTLETFSEIETHTRPNLFIYFGLGIILAFLAMWIVRGRPPRS